jgi:NTE family protein
MIKIILILLLFITIPVFSYSGENAVYNSDDIVREFLWNEFRELSPEDRPKIGIALSGGGSRGFGHIGVLEVLSNAGFPIDCISGTSMGAVVGAFFSSGLSTEKMWEIGKKASFSYMSKDFGKFGVLKLLLGKKLFSSEEMENFVTKTIGDVTFDQLKIPFTCSSMDIKTGEKIVFKSGSVAMAVRASMNMPGIFHPVHYRHRYLVDGGVIDYLPVSSVRKLCADWVAASVTRGDFASSSPDNILEYLLQVMEIRGALLSETSIKEADFVFRPQVQDMGFVDFDRSIEASERGVEEATRKLNEVKEILILQTMGSIINKHENS